MSFENSVRYLETKVELHFDLENVVRYLEKKNWLL